ncbi:hypothetical protein ACVPOR_13905 [Staphylococcus aureus]
MIGLNNKTLDNKETSYKIDGKGWQKDKMLGWLQHYQDMKW